MFDLAKIVARNSSIDMDDTAKIKFSLTALGYYDDSDTGLKARLKTVLKEQLKM